MYLLGASEIFVYARTNKDRHEDIQVLTHFDLGIQVRNVLIPMPILHTAQSPA